MKSDAAKNPVPRWSTYFGRLLWSPIELQKTLVLHSLLGSIVIMVIWKRIIEARGGEGVTADTSLVEALRSSVEFVPIFMEPIFVISLPVFLLMWTVVFWKPHPFGKRDYIWSLPVDRPAHDLWRVVAGAIHLVLAFLLVALIGGGFGYLEGIPLFPQRSPLAPPLNWPFWLSFFGVPVAIYLAASIAALATRFPIPWTYGAFALFLVPVLIASNSDSPAMDRFVEIVITGTAPRSDSMALIPALTHGYGSGFATWLQGFTLADPGPTTVPIEGRYSLLLRHSGLLIRGWHSTWLLACTLWMIPILGGLWLAARRRI